MRSYFLIILVILLGGVSGWYADRMSFTTIHDHGVTFKYPKKLFVLKMPSTLNMYSNYELALTQYPPAQASRISVSIPLKETIGDSSLSNALRGFTTNPTISQITIHGHAGEKASYRTKPIEGDIFVPATVTDEYYHSKINNSPIILSYYKVDGVPPLDDGWQEIKESIRW